MQDMVRKGIEAAEEDLHKDAEDRLMEEVIESNNFFRKFQKDS
jgi:hypothetical protein